MAKHVHYKKRASDRTCHLLSRMDLTHRNERRRVLRKAQTHTFRRGTFVADYVQNKYNNVYVEAMPFYDLLNDLYPGKTDLKKTEEYRVWKNNVTRDLSSYFNLQQAPKAAPSSPEPLEQTQQPEGAYSDSLQAASSSPEPLEQTQQPEGVYSDSLQAASSTPEPLEQTQQPECVYSDSLQAASSTPEPLEQTQQTKTAYNDKLQLKIPLMNSSTILEKSTVTTQTLQTITEETLASGVIEASLEHQIPSDIIDKIIEELRGEPELQDIFTLIEQQVDFEHLGTDLEIFEQDLLEKELQDW